VEISQRRMIRQFGNAFFNSATPAGVSETRRSSAFISVGIPTIITPPCPRWRWSGVANRRAPRFTDPS